MARHNFFFTNHPASVGETYLQHFRSASTFSGLMLVGGVACGIHAVIPEFFKSTASRIIKWLYDRMVAKRDRADRK